MFKRNQVEEAIINVWGPEPEKHEALLRNQIKRLLDSDRSLGRNKRSSDPERANFAFYSDPMQGKGRDNLFSGYEAFALLTALRLMQHGSPQGSAVNVLRQVRPKLEKEYSITADQDPTVLFDNERIMQQAKPGTLVVDNSDPVFVGLISRQSERKNTPTAVVSRGQESLIADLRSRGSGFALTALEVATTVHVLAQALSTICASRRGRPPPAAD
jgi:hypothetical protein